MTDGDGDGEGNTSPDPISEWQVEQLDAGNELSPLSSRYSSCGESEFDKYFSSNSVMGTPSMRSSVGPFSGAFESEFGSLRSLHDFSLGGSFERKVDDKKIVCVGEPNERIDGVLELYDGSSGCRDYHLGSTAEVIPDLSTALVEGLYDEDDGRVLSWDCAMPGETQSFNDNRMSGKENAQTNREDVSNFGVGTVDGDLHSSRRIDHFDNCLDQLSTEAGMGCDITKSGKCSHDGEASSRYEYSEGEDSLFGYGSGDEKRIDSNDARCIQVPCDENKIKETVLLMNSSTAFGSDDWDDYMQETNANPLSTVPDDFWVKKQQTVESDKDCCTSTFASSNGFQNICLPVQQEGKTSDNLSHDAEELTVDIGTYSTDNLLIIGDTGKKDICAVTDRFGALSLPKQLPQKCSGRNLHAKDQDLPTKDPSLKVALKIRKDESKGKHSCTSTEDETSVAHASDMKSEKTNSQLDSITKVKVSHLHATPKDVSEAIQRESLEGHISNTLQLMTENNVNRTMKENPASDHPASVKVGSHKINEFYDEIVHDMEEILLDANRSPGARLTQGNRSSQFQITMPLRDGSSTASTSNSDNAYSLMNRPLRIDRVEVIGARQKKGDVSLSERLVGVKEYTVYRLQVWSGEDKWEVERRYRDFYTLYRRLKTLFADQGWILPSPWSSVERESRKIFGNASPAAVAERSVLIKDCLQSLLDSQFSFSHSSALMWFLSTPKADRSSPAPVTEMHGSTVLTGDHAESISAFGKTISLVVDIWPNKSKRQILESQNYTCSGCHKHFDNGKTRIQDLVQNLGWGKPRLCEYSGQLFCASCHTNETAVLPARVLHFWDFAQYPVSQLAKYYLDSIHDQPMLCVSAVNPLLFSKVPALQHVTNVRKRIGAMLPYVRCPFRRTIFKGLGSRRYLLESYDFFALRDLIDLSKGVFAVLPVMVETVSKKILEHITEQCLVCCDVGVPCNARQACEDPSSLIFPFQEGDVKRCRSCKLVFHKCCFKKITTCPCGVRLKLDKAKELENKGNMDVDSDSSRTLDLVGRQDDSWSSVSLLSGLFSKTRLEKLVGHKDDNVIPMASLPNTSL